MNREAAIICGWVGAVLTAFFVFGFIGFALSQEGTRKDCEKDGITKVDGVLFRCESMRHSSAGEKP